MDNLGWQSTFVTVSILQVIALIVFVFVCPNDTRDRFYKPAAFDVAGTVTFSVLVSSLVLIASYGNSLGWTNIRILIGFAVATISFVALIIVENRAESVGTALLPWDLFKHDRNFIKIFLLAFATCFLAMGMTNFLPMYLQKVANMSATSSGIPFTIVSIATLIAAPVAAKSFKKPEMSKG